MLRVRVPLLSFALVAISALVDDLAVASVAFVPSSSLSPPPSSLISTIGGLHRHHDRTKRRSTTATTTHLAAVSIGRPRRRTKNNNDHNKGGANNSNHNSFRNDEKKRRPEQKRNDDAHRRGDEQRFDRTASNVAELDAPCIITIHDVRYNLTAWANAHPGGAAILQKFHGKNATNAFERAAHSDQAYEMLKDFAIDDQPALLPNCEGGTTKSFVDEQDFESRLEKQHDELVDYIESHKSATEVVHRNDDDRKEKRRVPRWRAKLFTREDPIGVHKFFGVFVLLHYAYRFAQMYVGDPSAGFGTRLGKGPSVYAAACLVPHAVLSLSSLIFHTVPRERVVGKPMIWQEYRAHNIIFAVRSIVSTALAWLSVYHQHAKPWRRLAVVGCSLSVLLANYAADVATDKLRQNDLESTTATMPYWDGCTIHTQRRFKSFYAYCQFLATLACMVVGNPAWSLSVLLPIQLASLLLTLVRKGLLSARGYHIGYTLSLIMPYFVGLRSMLHTQSLDILIVFGIGVLLYQLRRRNVNKYALWVPVVAGRIAYGDRFINYQAW